MRAVAIRVSQLLGDLISVSHDHLEYGERDLVDQIFL